MALIEPFISFLKTAYPDFGQKLRKALPAIGFETADWQRAVMYKRCFEFIRGLDPSCLNVMEISAGPQWVREFNFHSFTDMKYPEYDICVDRLDQQFDLIIADQVFEHLKWPYRAGRNVFAMLKPGGHFIMATPFLIRVHKVPLDCSRWTEDGLFYLLQECGFPAEGITCGSWGNRACVKGNFHHWPKAGYHSLVNEPDFPVVVWAFAQRPTP